MTQQRQADPVEIHVVDDDEPFRDSVVLLLESHGYRAIAHSSPRAFLAAAPGATHGCALVDVRMPEMNSLELQRALAAAGSKLAVIMLTGHADVPIAVQAMKAGAVDLIEKPFETAGLLDAIKVALTGRTDPVLAPVVSDEVLRFRERLPTLTEREREVLDLIVRGQPNKVVAYQLGISQRTVEIHRGRVMAKLRIVGAANLVRVAMATGLSNDSHSAGP